MKGFRLGKIWNCSLLLTPEVMFFTGKKGKQCLYHLYLETVSITNTRSQQLDEDCENDSDLKMPPSSHIQTFTPQDYETIADFVMGAGSDVFRQILHSICPSIFGHEMVKGEFSPTQIWKYGSMLIFRGRDFHPFSLLLSINCHW